MRPHPLVRWSGRLDNAAELAATFQRSAGDPAALALAAYQKWAMDGFAKLIGDWNLSITFPGEDRTILASDYAGVRPLYYRLYQGTACWSEALEHFASTDLDEDFLTDYICYGKSWRRTPFRDVSVVPPGHAVLISRGQATLQRFWQPPLTQDIRYRNPDDYAEELFNLFASAVRDRLANSGAALLELSGGLDSSTTVAMAAHVSGQGCSGDWRTVSYDEPMSTDERFIQAVEQHCGLPSVHLPLHQCLPADAARAGLASPELWQTRFEAVEALGASFGVRVLVTGILGDLTMCNWADDSEQTGDFLRRFEFTRALRSAFAWSGALGTPVYPIVWNAMRPWRHHASAHSLLDDSITPQERRSAWEREEERVRKIPLDRTTPPSLRKRVMALEEVLSGGRLRQPRL